MIDIRRLERLLHQLQTQRTMPQADRVATSIARWFGYYRRLQIVLERYHDVYTVSLNFSQFVEAQKREKKRRNVMATQS
jgi:hypothetical protein